VIAGRSDHASFGRAGIPAVALFTGFHADYHRASDVASRVDTRGIERVVDVVEAVVREPGGALASVSPWR
jgi:Zn-dependent M28 family amino/carboxypeptidase